MIWPRWMFPVLHIPYCSKSHFILVNSIIRIPEYFRAMMKRLLNSISFIEIIRLSFASNVELAIKRTT